jgi:hypothetical protein
MRDGDIRNVTNFTHFHIKYYYTSYVPLAFSCQRTIVLAEKTHEASEGVEYDFYFTEYDFISSVITCFDIYPLFNQINLHQCIYGN